MRDVVVVNGRFLTMQQTGVQRYARNLVDHLPAQTDASVVVALPPGGLLDAADADRIAAVAPSPRWHGWAGHLWEQMVLPGLVRRAGPAAVLLSPANWGPAAVSRQIAVLHDIAPVLHPELFTPGYRALAGALTPVLARRCDRLGATSAAVAADVARRYRIDPSAIDVIPPGVGAPFDAWPAGGADMAGPSRYCVAVGAHDRRKNIGWLLRWWPGVHRELGLELVVTTRGAATARFGEEIASTAGVTVRVDPDDDELCRLYAGALCLLWPSLYEGFGLPLLEAMAVGTPFLATDTGAARELAVEEDQIVPLDPAVWSERLRVWSSTGTDVLGAACRASAGARSWATTAAAAARSVDRVLRGGGR